MKVIVTHLKAPWPKGTRVDGVVTIEGDKLPAWALGKCRVLGEESDAPQKPKAEGKGDGKPQGKGDGK